LVTRRSSDALAIDDPDVVNAVRFIGENVSHPIEVRHVVEAVLISRRALERRFQHALNRTIQEEIRTARIGRAKMLLADEAIPIDQVARRSGFVSAGAMVAMFRRVTGTTPAAYRAALHGAK
jgi:LacI family transcriptional regulator